MREISVHQLSNHIGEEIGLSDWMEIRQDRIDKFAEATGDFQWIHVDVKRSNKERGGTIAHGFLILSLIPVLHESILEVTEVEYGLNYGLDKVRFTNSVVAGSKIRLRNKLTDVVQKQNGLLASYEFIVEIEGAERPALIANGLGFLVPQPA